jgi:glycerol-3-phosphate cytidylyltransferase-like family protein
VHHEYDRLHHVQTAFPTAHVILGDERDIFAPIRDLCPDLLAFGYDQRVPEDKIHELFPDIEIVRMGGHETEKWKSSLLRKTREYNTENIILVPGTGQSVKNYGSYK